MDRRDKLASSAAIPTPLLALLLAACGGGGGGRPNISNFAEGFVYDGPVRGAQVYIDADGDGRLNRSVDVRVGDPTNNQGSYSFIIPDEHLGKMLLVDLAGATDVGIDPNSTMDDRSTSGVWRAPAGSTIISPLTELMIATGQSATQIASALGLSGIDITTHNPFDGTNRTKDDILVIAAGVAVAEDLKVTNPNYNTILTNVGSSIRTLDTAYENVLRDGTVSNTEFGQLRDALADVYGSGIRNRGNDDITNDLASGIIYHLSSAVAVAADISARLASPADSIGEITGNTEKLVNIAVTKPAILGLELRFVVSGNGSEIFEVSHDSGDNWGLYVRDDQTLDFESLPTNNNIHNLTITLEVLDGVNVVHTESVGTFDLTVMDEDEPDASIHLDHRGRGDEEHLGVGDVVFAVVTPDGDALDATYTITWVRRVDSGEDVVLTGNLDGTYTLQQADIGEPIYATTTYTDFGNESVTVVSKNEILAGIESSANLTDATIAITHNGANVESLAAGNVLTATITPDVNDTQGSWTYTIAWVRHDVPELGRSEANEQLQATYTLQAEDIGYPIYALVTYRASDNPSNPELYNHSRITPGPIAQAQAEQAVGGFASEASSFGELDSNNADAATLPDII